MKLKEGFKKLYAHRNLFIAVCVFFLTIISIGISYSAFFRVKSNSSDQTVTTGTLAVTYSGNYLGGSNGGVAGSIDSLSTTNLLPLPDKEGLASTESKIIYIQNTGTLDSEYVLTIGYDIDNFGKRENSQDDDMLTPVEFIRVAVYEYNSANSESTLIAGPINVGDLPIYTYDKDDYKNNRYSLLIGNVGRLGSDKSTKTYQVKIWLSDKATPIASKSFFYVNSQIVATVSGAKRDYTINGRLIDASGTGIAGAMINFQNGSKKVQTSNDGSFTVADLPAGTYNVSIDAKNKTYEANLTIKSGENQSLSSMGANFTAAQDSTIFANAYANGTTIGKILKENDIKDSSNTYKFKAGSFKLAPTYVLTASSATVNNLKISIDDNQITNISF